MTDVQRRARRELLAQLASLRCSGDDVAATTAYVERRARLLAAVAQLEGEWEAEERALLVEALAAGELAMQAMDGLRAGLAGRLREVHQRRRFLLAGERGGGLGASCDASRGG